MVSSRRLFSCLVVTALLATVAIAGEADTEDLAGANVLITIRTGQIENGKKITERTYRIMAVDGGPEVELMSGVRVPVAVTRFQASTPPNREIVPMTSYTYQNVGFMAQIRVSVREDRRIQLSADIERSGVIDGTEPGSPWIETDHQRISAVLTEGSVLEITRMEDANGDTVYYEVEADIL